MNRDLNSTCNPGLTCKSPSIIRVSSDSFHRTDDVPSSPLVLLLPPLVLYPSLGSVCGRTMGTAADWASNPDEADSSYIDWAAGFLLLHSKKAVHLDWLSAVGHLFCYRSKSPKAKKIKIKIKNKSNSDLGDLCLCICLYVCLCVYVPGHVRECEQKQTNAEPWEQLASDFVSASLLIAFSQSAEMEKQNKPNVNNETNLRPHKP